MSARLATPIHNGDQVPQRVIRARALSGKTDRLYRNHYVTIDELNLDIHFVKKNVILSHDSRSSEKFMHGIKVLMARTTSTIFLRK
jgi:hypothetical protein